MLCVSVDFRLKPDAFEAFVRRVQQQAGDSLQNEPGCKVFEVWTSGDRPNEVHLHEVYDDAAAFDLHLQSGHFQAFDTDVADMIIDKKVTLWDRSCSQKSCLPEIELISGEGVHSASILHAAAN